MKVFLQKGLTLAVALCGLWQIGVGASDSEPGYRDEAYSVLVSSNNESGRRYGRPTVTLGYKQLVKQSERFKLPALYEGPPQSIDGYRLRLVHDDGFVLDSAYTIHQTEPTDFEFDSAPGDDFGLNASQRILTLQSGAAQRLHDGDTLAVLSFHVTSNLYFACLISDLDWLWLEPADNTLQSGETTLYSDKVSVDPGYQRCGGLVTRTDVTDPEGTLPTTAGIPTASLPQDDQSLRAIDFAHTQIRVECPEDIERFDGDCNNDGIVDQSELQLLIDLICGRGESQTCGMGFNDCRQNADDWLGVFQRQVFGDVPNCYIQKRDPSEIISIKQRGNTFHSNKEFAAGLFVFEPAGTVSLLAENMLLDTGTVCGRLHAVVYSYDPKNTVKGAILASNTSLRQVDLFDAKSDRLPVTIPVYSSPLAELRIGTAERILQGARAKLPVTFHGEPTEISGATLLVAIDTTALQILDVTLGEKLLAPKPLTLEFSTAPLSDPRFERINQTISIDLQKGHGVDAAHSAGTFSLKDGDTLCWVELRVANDRNLGCRLAPVWWFWRDCADNTLRRNDSLTVARTVIDARRFDECGRPLQTDTLTALHGGLPNLAPPDDVCPGSDGGHPTAPFLTLKNGGTWIICPAEVDDRGDCNFNGIPGDAEDIQCLIDGMLGRCDFVDPNCESLYWTPQIALLQSVLVDSPPCPYPDTRETLIVTGERVSTSDLFAYTFDQPVGAALFEFADSGTTLPMLGASGMIYESHNTPLGYRYLIYSDTGAVIRASNVISSTEHLLNVYAASPDGLHMDVLFNVQTSVAAADTAVTLPHEFALKQNFPNPFNPTTTVTFELPRKVEWELAVYNIAGQLVERFTGSDGPGVTSVSVHSSDWASGVYLYRFTAAEFAQSRKMVLLK